MASSLLWRGKAVIAVALSLAAALLIAAGHGTAATPPPPGALTPLAGTGSCLGGSGCAPLRGFGTDTKFLGLFLTAGNGGRTVYASGGTPGAIAVLDRDATTGALTQPPGPRGCITVVRVAGCALVRGVGERQIDLTISADGTRVAVQSAKATLLLSRDPRTGALRRIDGPFGPNHCLSMLDEACGFPRGIRNTDDFDDFVIGAHTRIVTGSEAATSLGHGIVVQHRGSGGPWHTLSGPGSCTDFRGKFGCDRLKCLEAPVVDAVAGTGKHVYLLGGGRNLPAYIATFRRTGSGGLDPVGCTKFPRVAAVDLPVWLQPVPHSSTVLTASFSYDHETGSQSELILASTPGANGALGRPQQVSGPLHFSDDGSLPPALSPDGMTLYGVGEDSGALYVYHVTPTAVTPFPAPWLNPFSTPRDPKNGLHDYGVDDTPLVSPDGRFVYVVTDAFNGPASNWPPAIRAYQVQP